MTKRKAAFFDIDGTLFRNSLLLEHFRLLTKDGIISKEDWEKDIKPLYQRYQNRQGAYEDYLDIASLFYQNNLKGIDKKTVEKYAKLVIEENKNKIYRVTKKAVKYHLDNDYLVFFISGSPDFLVKEYAEIYGAKESIATRYIFDEDGIFTGKVEAMWDSKNKLIALSYLVEKYDIDLNESHAYGDTNGDFSMLKSVGFAHAINPSYELIDKLYKEESLRNKTRIHVERKDVNYKFDLKDMEISFKEF